MSKKNNKTHKAGRSAKTGRFVKLGYAEKYPHTTVIERVPNPGHGDTK